MKNQNEDKNLEKKQQKATRNKAEKETGKPSVKERIHSKNFKHGTLSTLFSIGFIVVIVLINVIFSALTDRFPSMDIDLTKNSVNTLSDDAIKVVDAVDNKTVINILASETDANVGEYTQVVSLAKKMAERNSNITVQFVDLDENPTFKNKYEGENISAYNVVVETDKRYRVVTTSDLFPTEMDQNTYQQVYYQDVDSQLASAVSAVNADTLPVVAFDTGHQETGTEGYRSLLESNNFEVKEFNLLTDEIPEDAQMVVLNIPQSDLSDAEIEKLDKFLNSGEKHQDSTLMLLYYPGMPEVSNIESYINEWGLSVKPNQIVYENDTSSQYMANPSYLLMSPSSALDLEGSEDYGYILVPETSPVDILFETRGGVTTYPLFNTSEKSELYAPNEDGTKLEKVEGSEGSHSVGVLAQKVYNDNEEQKSYYSNVVVMGSGAMIVESFLNTNTFGNSKYMVDIARYGTGTTGIEAAVPSNKQQSIVPDITMSSSMMNWMGLGFFTVIFPLLILATGLVVFLKRRHL